ncbi:MAG: carboxy-S-adenosyl-L-methionine synthase CmoA [Xanthomonadales bacterium]|nr:carboxy-S-adenosyl-L-methionine synthase CmoA [Xanthomonadales bacterium]
MSGRDDLYRHRESLPGSFRFDDAVVDVFPDMIDRSVPGYSLIVPMIGQLARRYVQADSTVHDLGCSLGAVILSIRSALLDREHLGSPRLVATDNSGPMISRLEERLGDLGIDTVSSDSPAEPRATGPLPIELNLADIRDVAVDDASLVALNFTLQFLDPADRDELLQRVSSGLRPGGALILAEKIRFEDSAVQERLTDWHHDYKRLQGYSELEIARKRTALEQVLLTETEAAHRDRLERVGFRRVTRWFQCFGFCAWLAER